jgi:two-component system, OmpR family, sensor kinase
MVLHAAVGAVPQALAAGMFGVGFALRLARAELRAAGGELKLEGGKLLLQLPDLTSRDAGHSAQRSA